MKSLLLILFLLATGMFSFTNAQVLPQARNEANEGVSVQKLLFPDMQQDLSKLKAREAIPQPDKAVISTPFENWAFTNYQRPVVRNNAKAGSLKTATKASLPSDISSTEADNKRKAAQPTHPSKPGEIPSQGTEPTYTPPVKNLKKKN